MGTHGRRAAAWQSSQDCPSWSPLLAHLAEPVKELQTESLALGLEVGAGDVQQTYRVVVCTLKKELHEVESLVVQSTGLGEWEVSSSGNPSCDQECEAAERVLAPSGPFHRAPRVLGL